MTNDPDHFAADLHAELHNTARFTNIDSSELEAIYAAHDVRTRVPPPPPPPSNETALSGALASSIAEPEQERPTTTSAKSAAEKLEPQKDADAKIGTSSSTVTTCQQDAATEAKVPKQRRIRIIPPRTFSCLIAYEIRSQIQLHLRAALRQAATKRPVKTQASLPLPILAGGPSSKTMLHPVGQQRLNQLQKPPLVTVRIYLIGACISRAPPASVAQP